MLIRWRSQPKPASFVRAERELQRLGVPDAAQTVDRLRRGEVETVPAGELLRQMTGRAVPAVSTRRVQRQIERIRGGKRIRPVLAAGDAVVDGQHRLVAVAHLDPSAPVAVIRIGTSDTDQKEDEMSKKVKKAETFVNQAEAALLARVAEQLERASDHPQITALVSKIRAVAEEPRVAPGTNPNPGSLAKADRLGASLAELAELRKRTDLSPHVRERVEKAWDTVAGEYSHATASRSAAVAEDLRKAEAERRAMNDSRQVAVVGDDITRKAEELRKADPTVSHYDALLQAMGDRGAQEAYLQSVRAA